MKNEACEFSIEPKIFLDVIQKVGKVVDNKSNILILRCLLIEPIEDGIRISATNHRQWVRAKYYTGKSENLFSFAIPFADFKKILEHEKVNKIVVAGTASEPKLKIGRVSIDGLTAEDFPIFPDIKEVASKFAISKDSFITIIERMAPIVDESDQRAYMHGIFLSSEGFVVTDGRRLNFMKFFEHPVDEKFNAIVPINAFLLLQTILKSKSAKIRPQFLSQDNSDSIVECEKYITDSKTEAVRFTFGNWEITSRIVDANFPNFKKAFPNSDVPRWLVTLKSEALEKSIIDAKIFSGKDTGGFLKPLKLIFDYKAGEIHIGSESSDKNINFSDTVSAKFKGYLENKPIETEWDFIYFLQMIKVPFSEITLQIFGKEKQVVIENIYDRNLSETYTLMPIRI